MTNKELNDKWNLISKPQGGGLYARQVISSSCKPDLMIGVTSNGHRCVLLKLKSKLKFEFQEEEKENLKTYYNCHGTDNDLVLELKDSFFEIFFTDLVISLYQIIKNIDVEDESTALFINTVRYWSDFLKSKRGDFLSEEVVRGLFGELTYLEYLIDNLNLPINDVLNFWKGPFDANHDFELIDKNVEVKTKLKNSKIINIASEYQLEIDPGKELELAVVTIELLKDNGDTLKQIVNRIREKIIAAGGLMNIFRDALSEKRLDFNNVEHYDCYQFNANYIDVYDCDHDEFPKLIHSQLKKPIVSITYRLVLAEIDFKHLINTIQLNRKNEFR